MNTNSTCRLPSQKPLGEYLGTVVQPGQGDASESPHSAQMSKTCRQCLLPYVSQVKPELFLEMLFEHVTFPNKFSISRSIRNRNVPFLCLHCLNCRCFCAYYIFYNLKKNVQCWNLGREWLKDERPPLLSSRRILGGWSWPVLLPPQWPAMTGPHCSLFSVVYSKKSPCCESSVNIFALPLMQILNFVNLKSKVMFWKFGLPNEVQHHIIVVRIQSSLPSDSSMSPIWFLNFVIPLQIGTQ